MRNDSVYRLSLAPRTADSAEGPANVILENTQQQFGFVPNRYAGMANSPELLATYTQGYHLFRQSGRFTPPEQEVVFLSISAEHGCRYCVAAHSMVAEHVSGVPGPVIEAIRRGKAIPDARLAALAEFTRSMVRSRGNPTVDDGQRFLAAGFTELHMLDIILAIAVKTLSNYSNHVFHTAVDGQFAGFEWTGTFGS